MGDLKPKLTYGVFALFWVLIFSAAEAGGLGISPVVAIAGLIFAVSLTRNQGLNWISKTPKFVWGVFAFLLWGYITSFWSPYVSGAALTNPVKLLIGVPLYMLAVAWIATQPDALKPKLGTIAIVISLVWSVLLFADLVSGYSLSWAINPPVPGQDVNKKIADSIQNLSHAVTVATLLLAPILALSWHRTPVWRIFVMGFAIIVLNCAGLSGSDANISAGIVTVLVFLIALYWRPKLMLGFAFLVSASSVLFAPIIGWMATNLTPEFKAKLPFSWEERVDNWAYVYTKILQKPLLGNGFDATRTFNETHTIRGFEGRAIVSLHPHNAGLHIWAELGAVGVFLALVVFALGWKAVQSASLNTSQIAAFAGLMFAVAIISAVSFGVWQDWWWAAVIICSSLIWLVQTREAT